MSSNLDEADSRPAHGSNHEFLAGGGEVGARMRALDWTANPLGPPHAWPQSLKTIVRVMLDSRYAMWMLWGPELTFFCNDAYLPTVGIKRDWVLGARSDKVWEEIWPDISPRIERVLEQGQATWDEGLLLFLERSGFPEETYHTFSYSPVYDDENRVAGMLCVVTEVTERVIGERRLRVLRDLAAPLVGLDGVDATCRRACEVLASYPLDVPFAALYRIEGPGLSARSVARTHALPEETLPPTIALDDVPSSPWPTAAVIDTKTAQELHNLPKAGIEIAAQPWTDDLVHQAFVLPLPAAAQQGLSGFLIVGVSPRRPLDEAYRAFIGLIGTQIGAAIAGAQAYEAERRRSEALAELDRAKTAFFSNVSHEFRTPLTLMLGPLETVLADGRVPADQRKQLELARRNAERLRKLVNSLLDFSRIEAGRVQAEYESTDLAALTRDLASTFRSAMEKADLRFTVDCPPLPETVFVDREMWEKIVLNLLSNAFKFTLNGSVAVRVTGDDGHAVLEVADTGVGVPEAELPRLFQRFYRVEGTHGRTHEGSGIGLALVQELVKQHGGTIGATSELGRGTKFVVRVPFGTEHLPVDRIKARATSSSTAIGAQAFVEEALRWLEGTPADATSTVATLAATANGADHRRFVTTFGSRIVLADDNADMRGYVSALLAPFYAVEALPDGERALEAARRARPDLILSDVMMPRLDGFGLLGAIREDEQLRNVPVVLLSARAGEEARIEGLDAGADDYLIKPFSARELLARVGALLELTQMRRAAEDAFRLRTAQLETADRQKDEFLAMLAHELRNPLAPIRSAAEVLSRTAPIAPHLHGAISVVQRQTAILVRLVDDLLDVSRITQGRIELKRRSLKLADVVAQAVETVEPLIREKQQKLTVTTHGALRVNGDPARLVQCVANVLTNAAKYTDAHGEIHVEMRGEGAETVVTISDNGTGIPSDLLPHLFELFVQSHRTLDRSQGGLGIGLSVVKRLVEMHGGRVGASSSGPGHGSTFEIRLPLAEREDRSAIDAPPQTAAARRVLVVDDNEDAANTLSMILSLDGHDVQTVFSARAALERVREFAPDVVLLDIGLPEIDGYEVARRIRKQPELAPIRLVALTGYGQTEDRQRTQAAGFDDHLVKPVEMRALQQALSAASR